MTHIFKMRVDVTARRIGDDIEYTISGSGALDLHKSCLKHELHPSDLKNDSFTIKRSQLGPDTKFGKSHTVKSIRQDLANVTPKLERAGAAL